MTRRQAIELELAKIEIHLALQSFRMHLAVVQLATLPPATPAPSKVGP